MFKTLVAIVAASLIGVQVASAQASGQATPTKIAIVNTVRIFNDMQELKDLRQKMDSERKLLEGMDREKRERLNNLKNQRDTLKPETPQYQEKNSELMRTAIEYETWGKLSQINFQREQKQQTKMLFQKIETAVAEVGKQKGYDLVLADQRPEIPDDLDNLQVEQLRALITSRNVIYVADKIDISADVLALLDQKYKAQAK
jgi:Skp family chaperone for outer membrane proteins